MKNPPPANPGHTDPNHTDAIACSGCRNTGAIIWEEAAPGQPRQMVRIEGDFYERVRKAPPNLIELVCNKCGKAQPSPLQS